MGQFKKIVRFLIKPLQNERGLFGIDDAIIAALITSAAMVGSTAMQRGQKGGGGNAVQMPRGRSQQFGLPDIFQSQDRKTNTSLLGGGLSTELTGEPLVSKPLAAITPFQQNDLDMMLTSLNKQENRGK